MMPGLLAIAMLQYVAAPAAASGLHDAERLRPFLDKLAQTRQARRPVRIVQIGDSHTAADQVTGSWRTLIQTRYGSAGRGVLPPGRPYAGYLTRGVTVSQSAGWSVNGIFGPAYAGTGAPDIGVSSYSQTTTLPGASMSLVADPTEAFDRFTVCALTGPGQGTLALTAGTSTATWSLDADSRGSDCRTVKTDTITASGSLSVVSGPVTVTSWATEKAGSGVSLSNLGTVGAQLEHLSRASDPLVETELREYKPDLIVLAFGTNEAFRPGFSASDYTAKLQAGIRRLRRFAPGTPILLLGAPDSATKLPSLQIGAAGASAACPTGDGAWRPTAALALVQAIQQRTAHDLGIAYWDWSSRMGGRCTTIDWTARQPAMMRGDHVHFTKTGGAEIARLLQADIDAAAASVQADIR